jgi:hypothetical protein
MKRLFAPKGDEFRRLCGGVVICCEASCSDMIKSSPGQNQGLKSRANLETLDDQNGGSRKNGKKDNKSLKMKIISTNIKFFTVAEEGMTTCQLKQ